MTEHTPGPWSYIPYSTGPRGGFAGFISGSTADNTYIVAEVVEHDGSPESLGEAFQNGPFIAAAPDLLEQRDELLAALESAVLVLHHNDWQREKAHAAIAKATGETP